MIALKCPHCGVRLKVDEQKIPHDIKAFKCPKCKGTIPINTLREVKKSTDQEPETTLLNSPLEACGQLTVIANEWTKAQTFTLHEGVYTIGRASHSGHADLAIQTDDHSMSRTHCQIEIKKDKQGYKHYLSDNNSKNHTLYNDSYLEKEEIVILHNNDKIIIGRTIIKFNV